VTRYPRAGERYEGTRFGWQELNAEILDEAEGALWRREMIVRYAGAMPGFVRVAVAVDPPASSSCESALAGVVAAGLTAAGKCYVIADRSGRKSPAEWASTALALH
jgi:phage terminase large subunit-like protein